MSSLKDFNLIWRISEYFLFRHGFVLPADQIIPSGEEMWAGFEVVINRLIEVSEAEKQ